MSKSYFTFFQQSYVCPKAKIAFLKTIIPDMIQSTLAQSQGQGDRMKGDSTRAGRASGASDPIARLSHKLNKIKC